MLRIEETPVELRLQAARREIGRSLREGGGLGALDDAVELIRLALFAGLDEQGRLRLAREVLRHGRME